MNQTISHLLLYIIDSVGLVAGIISFRYLNGFLKLLFYQFLVAVFFGIVGLSYLYYLASIGLPPNNMWMMNIQLLFEMELIFYALFWVLKTNVQRKLILGSNVAFLLTYFIQMGVDGFRVYVNWADLVACLGFTFLLYLVFFELSKVKKTSWWKSPEIIATISLFIYFACSVPFISMNNYLRENHPEIANFIYYNIAVVLGHLRYAIFVVALFMTYKNQGKELIRP